MQRPKWLSGWRKGKNIFEGSLIIDLPGLKVVEASYDNKLLFFAVGVATEGKEEDASADVKRDYNWRIFYDPTVMPTFVPVDNAKELMTGAVAVSSRNASVYGANTHFVASRKQPSKGNAPLLLDYEIAKKIENAKKER